MAGFGFLNGLFTNYEVVKLHISNPFLLNSLIYCSLLLVTLMTLRKKPSTLLDFSQTEQLKGLAMLFVVVGHFWLHVCNEHGPFLYIGDYAVTLFLLLSGYGLMTSNIARRVNAREFVTKRLRKILVPYWVATIGIIALDYILLQKHYPLHELLLTFSGINLSEALKFFDYARWFITLLLIYYLAFFFCAKLWSPPSATLALLCFSLVLILFRRTEFFPLGARHQLLAFPLGCLLALIFPSIEHGERINLRRQIVSLAFTALAMLFIFLGRNKNGSSLEKVLFYLDGYILPYLYCLILALTISVLASTGYTSKFLGLCGYLSYEVYLIHGPLLVKYNPVLGYFENNAMLVGILLWGSLLFGLAYALKLTTSGINHLCKAATYDKTWH